MLCNGCYGFLLSVYEIKAGKGEIDTKASGLLSVLEKAVSADKSRRLTQLLRLRDNRMTILDERTTRLIATSEYVAKDLRRTTGLDWSAAVIGICKAVEFEMIHRIINPLRSLSAREEFAKDAEDPDLRRVARYCAGDSETPPEIGVISRLLMTVASSKTRIESSPVLRALTSLLANWPDSRWLTQEGPGALDVLVSQYRNRAAHIDELTRTDYGDCCDMVLGTTGLMWQLIRSTSSNRR